MVLTRSQVLLHTRGERPRHSGHASSTSSASSRESRGHRTPINISDEETAAEATPHASARTRTGRTRSTPVAMAKVYARPQREAAQRALENLVHTYRELDGNGHGTDRGGAPPSSSSSSNHIHYRHHPELAAHAGGGNTSSDESSTSSREADDDDGAVHASSPRGSPAARVARQHQRLNLHRAHNGDSYKRGRGSSAGSSISAESMRASSVERMAEGDARAARSDVSSHEGDDDVTEAEMRRAARQAKESVQKNYRINYYMHDAVGEVDPKAERRKQLDRRYRHLYQQDYDAKAKERDGAGGTGAGSGGGGGEMTVAADITPIRTDPSITFARVGGLPGHIVMLREMVLLPLLYPDLLARMNLSPPRGVLFVGPPGTGKTLVARALASEGEHWGHQKITFFMRKGADLLSKWVGESERQLHLLFEEAKRQQPSIIFFDEIDGLAPTRHTKTEQSQAALVATFLALLDGLDSRGQIVVIGATNRPDTLDPAFRRPGRFDRELVFSLPDAAARRHILSIVLTKVQTVEAGDGNRGDQREPPPDDLIAELVPLTEGYSGADLSALCTEAGLHRLRTALPQLYTSSRRLALPASPDLVLRKEDFFAAAHRLYPSMQRGAGAAGSSSTNLAEHLDCLLRGPRDVLRQHLAAYWTPIRRALEQERRNCADLQHAVIDLSSFPIPYVRHPLLLFMETLSGDTSSSATALSVEERGVLLRFAALAVMRGLPTFRTYNIHLPHLHVGFGELSQAVEVVSMEDFTSGHWYQLVQAIQHAGPCVVLLRGVEEWLQEQGLPNLPGPPTSTAAMAPGELEERQQRMEALRYYLNLLTECEVLLIVPCVHATTRAAFLGDDVQQKSALLSEPSAADGESGLSTVRVIPNGRLHPLYRVVCAGIRPTPSDGDLQRFVQYVYRTVSLALRVQQASATAVAQSLPEDASTAAAPPPSSLARQTAERKAKKQAWATWRVVEYRRLQLRHVLIKWVGQYITSGKYKLLLEADLDLTPSHPLYSSWQRHTKGCRIGLRDIMEKIESEEYVCLSQYHDDVDQLVQNVRTFFRTRAATDLKYRLKALDLKETTVLNVYKINRNVVRFCEEHRELQEPSFSSDEEGDDDEDMEQGQALATMSSAVGGASPSPSHSLQFTQRPVTTPRPRPKLRIFGQRRRRRRPRVPPAKSPAAATTTAMKTEEVHVQEKNEDDDAAGEPHADGDRATAPKDNEDDHKISESGGVSSDDDGGNDPRSPTVPKASLEQWAVNLLRGMSYSTLNDVFQGVMYALEMEVRRREERVQTNSTSTTASASDAVRREGGVKANADGTPAVLNGTDDSAHPSLPSEPAREPLEDAPCFFSRVLQEAVRASDVHKHSDRPARS